MEGRPVVRPPWMCIPAQATPLLWMVLPGSALDVPHTCALTTGSNVVCWGAGSSGRLGNGGTASSSTPVDVHTSSSNSSALGGIAGISSGYFHTCALTTDGNVKCWGSGNDGRLGNKATINSLTPVDVHASLTDNSALDGIAGISSGNSHTCALTTGGNVVCWGAGDSGQLGNGGTSNRSTPVDVHTSSSDSSALSGIAAISSGDTHTCALTTGGNVKCWGNGQQFPVYAESCQIGVD